MPFIKKDARKHHRSENLRKFFVGRANELLFFKEGILKPDSPSHNIITIYGQGGVGKTTLIKRYIEMAQSSEFKDHCQTAMVDHQYLTPDAMMEKIAEQLNIQGEFEKTLGHYKEAVRKQQEEQKMAREAILRKFTTDAAASVAKAIPIPILSEVIGEEIGTVAGYFYDELSFQQKRRDAKRLENPIKDLTKSFVRELNRRNTHRTILFFDTFEQLAPEIVPWLLDHFLMEDVDDQVILVIAGRDSIEKSLPNMIKQWLPYFDSNDISPIQLECFTEDETRAYLEKKAIFDTTYISAAYQLSRGLPLYLSLLTYSLKNEVDPTVSVVDNFLRWIPESEIEKRQLALNAALFTKPFNRDDLESLIYHFSDDKKATLYDWLIRLSFIHGHQGQHRYHDTVREIFCRYLYQNNKKEYDTNRRAIADSYLKIIDLAHNEEDTDIYDTPEGIELAFAVIQQLFLVADEAYHIKAIEQTISAWYGIRETRAGDLLRVLQELLKEPYCIWIKKNKYETINALSKFFSKEKEKDNNEIIKSINYLLDIIDQKTTFPTEYLKRVRKGRGSHFPLLSFYRLLEPCVLSATRHLG